eukprot:scaffold109592_cov14-Tisochrysis_lutea.AAC.1
MDGLMWNSMSVDPGEQEQSDSARCLPLAAEPPSLTIAPQVSSVKTIELSFLSSRRLQIILCHSSFEQIRFPARSNAGHK